MFLLNTAVSQFATFLDGHFISRSARFRRIPYWHRIGVIIELLEAIHCIRRTTSPSSKNIIIEFSDRFEEIKAAASCLNFQTMPLIDQPSTDEATAAFRCSVARALLKIDLSHVLVQFWLVWTHVHTGVQDGDLEINGEERSAFSLERNAS